MMAPAGGRQGRFTARRKSARVLRGVRLGLPRDFFFDAIAGEVQNVFASAVRLLRKLGAKITPISIPLLQETEDAGNQIAWAEATHFHRQSAWFPARSRDYSEDVRKRLEIGDHVSAGAYLRALETREQFIQQMSSAMEAAEVHALIVPTTPVTAPRIAEETTRVADKQFSTRALLLRLNRPANLAGVPAISIPCGITPVGLPVGLQLIGVANGEALLLDVAHAFELACPGVRPPLEFTF